MSNQYVLVINSGSSSLKFAVIDSQTGKAALTGLGECFGLEDSRMSWKYQGNKQEVSIVGEENHHQLAIKKLVDIVNEYNLTNDVIAIGHRIVHGGEKFTKTVQIDQHVLKDIESVKELAPLHAPANVIGIKAALEAFHLFLNSLYSTQLSTKPCQLKPTQVRLIRSYTMSMRSVVMVSTVQVIIL